MNPARILTVMTAVLVASTALAAEAKHGSCAEFDARVKARERINVVFFGASLTWGANASDPAETSHRGGMIADNHGHGPAGIPPANIAAWQETVVNWPVAAPAGREQSWGSC